MGIKSLKRSELNSQYVARKDSTTHSELRSSVSMVDEIGQEKKWRWIFDVINERNLRHAGQAVVWAWDAHLTERWGWAY